MLSKGNRGLTLHLNSNPNCRRNVRSGNKVRDRCGCGGACAGNCCTDFCDNGTDNDMAVDVDSDSLARQVSEAIKSPSTSVKSLEHLCKDSSVSKICKHPHKNNRTCKLCCVLSP